MTTTVNLDNDAIAQSGLVDPENKGLPVNQAKGSIDLSKEAPAHAVTSATDSDVSNYPTDEELRTLRRISGKIKWSMWTIAFVELCERFSYYGSAVLYTNFVNNPLPEGSTTGSPADLSGQPGALNMGSKAAQGLSLTNQFPDSSFAAFIIGLLTLCVGTGFFKANVSPLLAEQGEDTHMHVTTLKTGERVIVDPAVTNTRVFLYFYMCINIGSLSGQIGMVWVENLHGFWQAFLIPTALFLIAPFVLWSNKKKYKLTPPTGSLLSKFLRLFRYVQTRSSFWKPDWELGKPSNIAVSQRPVWMTFDDAWVDEVRRGLMACRVFLFLPIFFLAYNQMTGNLTIQASTMTRHGTPNDILQNLNPISIVIMIPIIDYLLYPGLRKAGIAFTPIKRMAAGFFFSAASMVAAAVMQYYIYKTNPDCGWHINDGKDCAPSPINVWAQCLPYILVGLSEIFTNVTSYEYAFSKAPENMKSLVMSVNLFMSAISAAIGQAFTPLSGDPYLVWNYTTVAIIAFLGGAGFWFCFRHLDSEEDKWNMLKKTEFIGTNKPLEKDTKEV
ncbi:proton-dependent oligopeptide transporter, POT family [Geosmithia morbida]|uniref:Proton-dependent oligopeptide transporter, POT family n=1 Tax=Geosmithia morbida TaxID=1094350 RepID=A0A9P4YYN7_9HYPO|nr:proton-dependent oligopeptide transporter, POT family [Geosmithia morbida]KAF4125511.1 proton-dependent oligopeptide transporter, POT family [Geosmithia morbida]